MRDCRRALDYFLIWFRLSSVGEIVGLNTDNKLGYTKLRNALGANFNTNLLYYNINIIQFKYKINKFINLDYNLA